MISAIIKTLEQELREQVFVARRPRSLGGVHGYVLFERADRRADEPRNNVICVLAEHHARLEQLRAELAQEATRLHLADELVRVGQARAFDDDARGFEDPVAARVGFDRELVARKVDLSLAEPLVERRLREEHAVFAHAGHECTTAGPAPGFEAFRAPSARPRAPRALSGGG